MGKDRRERDRKVAEASRAAAEQMVHAREILGFGGARVVEPANGPFDLRLVFIMLHGIGFGWIAVNNTNSTAYYTLKGSRWDLTGIAQACRVSVLASGDFPATRRGVELEISFLTVSAIDEGTMTQAMIEVLQHS